MHALVTYIDEEAQKVKCTLFSLPFLNEEFTGENLDDLIINEFYIIFQVICLVFLCDSENVMIGNKKAMSNNACLKNFLI